MFVKWLKIHRENFETFEKCYSNDSDIAASAVLNLSFLCIVNFDLVVAWNRYSIIMSVATTI